MSIKVYDKARGTFAWRLWHEPDSDKSGCTKEKDKAIELRLINQPENLNLLYEDEHNYIIDDASLMHDNNS